MPYSDQGYLNASVKNEDGSLQNDQAFPTTYATRRYLANSGSLESSRDAVMLRSACGQSAFRRLERGYVMDFPDYPQ